MADYKTSKILTASTCTDSEAQQRLSAVIAELERVIAKDKRLVQSRIDPDAVYTRILTIAKGETK